MNKVFVITGATASGKSDLALKLAEKINGEIVSADSMQVYRKMNIGTAKPELKDMEHIPHHMINVCDIGEEFSVARYKQEALLCINDILMRKKIPIITGGTGLYIDSLVYGISFDQEKQNNKAIYEQYLNENGTDKLYELLLECDAQAAIGIHPNNTKRVIRYLDILSRFDGTLKEYKSKALQPEAGLDFEIIVLNPPRDILYKRIEDRVDIMLKKGLVDEVIDIIKDKKVIKSNALQAIGYKEIIMYLRGYCTYDEMVLVLKKNTRNYAKRQIAWFKRYSDAKLIDPQMETDVSHIINKILQLD